MRALILNDTSRQAHLGCKLVMHQLIAGCRANNIEVPWSLPLGRRMISNMKRVLPKVDLVLLNGEGTMHHDSEGALALAEASFLVHRAGIPLVLLNTVWEQNDITNGLLRDATLIFARETLSADAIKQHGYKVTVVPDLSLTYNIPTIMQQSQLNAAITIDSVLQESTILLSQLARTNRYDFYRLSSRPNLHSLKSLQSWLLLLLKCTPSHSLNLHTLSRMHTAKFVVSGRFHGVCMSIMARRPFIAVPSNTHKIKGLLQDAQLGAGGLFIDNHNHDIDAFIDAITSFEHTISDISTIFSYTKACDNYINTAITAASAMFNQIKALSSRPG